MRSTRTFAVALSLLAICLQASVAYAESACTPTGSESIATDKGSYQAGETVQVTGLGFAPRCDLTLRVTRPDGSVVTGDGSETPGSDSVLTSSSGGIGYEYRLLAIAGEYTVDALGVDGVVLATTSFADAKAWTFAVSPATTAVDTSTVLTFNSTNTSSTTVAAERIGCVIIAIDPAFTPVGSPSVTAVTNGRHWSATRTGQVITATANLVNGGTDDAVRRLELVRLTQTVIPTTATGSPFAMAGTAYSTNTCSGDLNIFPAPNVDASNPAGRQPVIAAIVNAAPSALDDSYNTPEDQQLVVAASSGVLANDSDADAQSLTAQLVTSTTHGTLSLTSSGAFTYTPAANYFGPDAFTYRARDPYTSTVATVAITVGSVNDIPIPVDDLARTMLNTAVDIDVLANDVDVDGSNSDLRVDHVGNEVNGVASVLGDGRTVRFTPSLDRSDANVLDGFSFTYAVTDGAGVSGDALVEIRVASNAAPVCGGTSITLDEDTAATVASNCSDANGDALTFATVSQPAHGTLSFDGSTFSYTPDADYFGLDSFTYTASDAFSTAEAAVVSISVASVNDVPRASTDEAITGEDTAVVIGVTVNDTTAPDPDEVLQISGWDATSAHDGTVVCALSCTYTPPADYAGPDTFSYTLSDGNGGAATATVSITVTEVNDVPSATDATAAFDEDSGGHLIEVLAGDVAGPVGEAGQALSIGSVSDPDHGAATISDGRVRYTADAHYFGADSFTYQVCDDGTTAGAPDAQCALAAVGITIAPVDDAPVIRVSTSTVRGQYSDPLAPVTIVVTDVDDAGSSLDIAASGTPSTLWLTVQSGSTSTPTPESPGTRTATLWGTLTGTPGDYAVSVAATDAAGRAAAAAVTVQEAREDAGVTYTGQTTVYAASPDAATASAPLHATVRDITALDPATDPNAGAIVNASVRFVDRTSGATLCAASVVPFVDDERTGTASCNATLPAGTTVRVGTIAGGRYVRDNASDDVLVTVARPAADSFVTGRGFLMAGSAAGVYAPDLGSRIPFSMNAKYTKAKSSLSGNASVSFTSGRRSYQIDASLLGALGSVNSGGVATATFNGEGALLDVTDPNVPVLVRSGVQVQLALTDRGEPGTQDTLSIVLYDGSRLLMASRWDGSRPIESTVSGGNLIVR
jgi:large repetitive protein